MDKDFNYFSINDLVEFANNYDKRYGAYQESRWEGKNFVEHFLESFFTEEIPLDMERDDVS